MISTLFLIFLGSASVLWTLPFVILIATPFKLFQITSREQVTKIRKRFKARSSVIIDDELGSGFFLTRRYIGYIKEESSPRGGSAHKVYIVTTQQLLKKLLDVPSDIDPELGEVVLDGEQDVTTMTIWERHGSYFDLSYNQRKLLFPFHPRSTQEAVIARIKEVYEAKHNHCVMLHGEPGTGKTMIGRFLAIEYSGHYCDTLNPTDPGDEMGTLYNSISPTKTKPLILVLDEFDTILLKIHEGTIDKHKYIPIPIQNKTGWNQFLDRFSIKTWPNVILLLISNRSPKWVSEHDTSYTRKGRVDDIIEL